MVLNPKPMVLDFVLLPGR